MIKTLKLVLYIFCLYIIIEQLIRLTYSTVLYNYNFNYAKILSKLCKKSKIEINTIRYNLYNNYKNYYIKNSLEDDSQKNKENIYNIYIKIFSIVFTIYISLLFCLIIYNYFIKSNINFSDYKIEIKIYIVIIIFLIICFLIYPILLIISKIANIESLNKKIDIINIFRKTYKDKKYNDHNYFIYIYISILLVLIILKFYCYYNNINLPDFKEKIDNNNNIFELIFLIIYIFIYTFILYYVLNIISIINNKEYEKQINYFENNNYRINNKDNIIIIFLEKIFGYKEHNNYENINYVKSISASSNGANQEIKVKKNINKMYRKNISGLIFIFVIFLLSLCFVYFIIYNYYNHNENIKIFLKNIKNYIIIPILSITIILFILNSTLQYNTIYNNLIKEVNNIYLSELSKPNKTLIEYLKNNKSYKIVNNLKLGYYHAIYYNLFQSLNSDYDDFTLLINEKNDISNKQTSKKFNFNSDYLCNIYNIKFSIKDRIFRNYSQPKNCDNNIESYYIKYDNLKKVCNNIMIDINNNEKKKILSKYKDININIENIDDIVRYMYYNILNKNKKIKNDIYDKVNNLEKYIYKTLNYIYTSESSSTLNNKNFYDNISFSLPSSDDEIIIEDYNCFDPTGDADAAVLIVKKQIVKNQLNNIIKTIKNEYEKLIIKNLLLKVLAENKIINEYNKIFKNKNDFDNINFCELLNRKSIQPPSIPEPNNLYDMEFNDKIINEYEKDLFNIIKDFFENIHKIIIIKIKTKEEENIYNNYKIINGDNSINFEKLIEKEYSIIETNNNIKLENDLNLANYLIFILLLIYILLLLIIKYIN